MSDGPLLEVKHVVRSYRQGGLFGRVMRAVDDVSFEVGAAGPEVLAIIGESGSGKTTLARMILTTVRPSAGSIHFKGLDLNSVRSRAERLAFMRQVQPIFQNPFEAFNPLKRLDRYLFMTARHFAGASDVPAQQAAADAALRKVGLSLAEVQAAKPDVTAEKFAVYDADSNGELSQAEYDAWKAAKAEKPAPKAGEPKPQ